MDSPPENYPGIFDIDGLVLEGLQDTRISPEEDFVLCKICSNTYCDPRVLSCLHVFCEECLNKGLTDESGTPKQIIVCPECQQETKVLNGASSLPLDFVRTNVLKAPQATPFCSSCESGLEPMSCCYDCAQYICAYCFSAHQTMRCFKGHYVVQFDENGHSGLEPIHQPIVCGLHPSERLRFFCTECQVILCNQCALSDHLAHNLSCKSLEEVLPQHQADLEKLAAEIAKKSELCANLSASLEKALVLLQQQHDNAEELVFDVYKIYKTLLKKCRDDRLQEIRILSTERELKMLDDSNDLEKFSGNVEDAFTFTSHLLQFGNAAEILILKDVVSAQLLRIIDYTPQIDVNSNVQLGSTIKAFENVLQAKLQAARKPLSSVSSEFLSNDPNSNLPKKVLMKLQNVSVNNEGAEPCKKPFGALVRSTAASTALDPPKPKVEREYYMKFGKVGSNEAEFNSPQDFCIDREGDFIVADTGNHRIQIYDKNGEFKTQFGGPGTEDGQLFYPLKIAVFQNLGNLVICDIFHQRSRLQMFTKSGRFIKKIRTIGLGIFSGLTVTKNGRIVAVNSETVFVLARSGEVLLQFDCCKYVESPSDIIFRGNEFYVCDFRGESIAIFEKDGTFRRHIKREANTEWHPSGIDITRKGLIVVGASRDNHFHVVAFDPQGRELFAAHCLEYKVWRCGGLKLTSEGFAVTIARYENFVLIMKNISRKLEAGQS